MFLLTSWERTLENFPKKISVTASIIMIEFRTRTPHDLRFIPFHHPYSTHHSHRHHLAVCLTPARDSLPIAGIVAPHGEVTAVDIQEGMLNQAQERARKADITTVRFLRAGLREGRLEHNYYDRAVMVTVLGEIPDREAVLRELFDALKPGGILLVEETIRDPHFQTHGTVSRLAGAAGFREKDFFGNRFSYTLLLEKPSRE